MRTRTPRPSIAAFTRSCSPSTAMASFNSRRSAQSSTSGTGDDSIASKWARVYAFDAQGVLHGPERNAELHMSMLAKERSRMKKHSNSVIMSAKVAIHAAPALDVCVSSASSFMATTTASTTRGVQPDSPSGDADATRLPAGHSQCSWA